MRTNLSDVERLALLVGSLCHDLDHRGTNNQFQIKYTTCFLLRIDSFISKLVTA